MDITHIPKMAILREQQHTTMCVQMLLCKTKAICSLVFNLEIWDWAWGGDVQQLLK